MLGFNIIIQPILMMSYARKMKIYLARHGRTNYNDLDLCNSDPSIDVHLTKKGAKQAEALANKLKDVPIDRIFVSELRRTRQTAEIVNQLHHVDITTEPLLNDHRSGYEGRPASLLMEALDKAENKWTARFNDGESIEDVKSRVGDFLNTLKKESHDAILIITSGWVIRAAIAIIQNIPNEEAWAMEPEQGDYLEFEV